MKLPDFDYKKASWDRFKRFFMTPCGSYSFVPFIQFDTGELMVIAHKLDPEYRQFYASLNLSVYLSSDDQLPELFLPDGTKVPKAWLGRIDGNQHLLFDHDTERVVSLEYWRHQDASLELHRERIPASLQGHATAYFAGPGQPPVGRKVRVSRPVKLDPAQQAHVKGLIAASQAWVTLTEPAATKVYGKQPGVPIKDLVDTTFAKLSDVLRIRLVRYGTEPWFSDEWFDYLTFKSLSV